MTLTDRLNLSFGQGRIFKNPSCLLYNALLPFFSSDDTSHAGDEYFSEQKVLDVIKNVTDLLGEIGLTVYPVLGNHDWHPKSQIPAEPNATRLYQETGEMWKEWLPEEALREYKENGTCKRFPC